MGTFENIANAIIDGLTKSIRRFVAFMFLLFTAGVIYGTLVSHNNPGMLPFAIGIPLVLAVLAYFHSGFALAIFLLASLLLLTF